MARALPLVVLSLLLNLPTDRAHAGPTLRAVHFQVRPSPQGARLESGGGPPTTLLQLVPRIVLRHSAGRCDKPFVVHRLQAHNGRLELEARVRCPTLEATLELEHELHSPELHLRLRRRYLRSVTVRREVLRFSLPRGARLRAVDRAYRLVDVGRPLLVGVESPLALVIDAPSGRRRASRLAFYGSASISHALLQPRRGLFDLELDDRRQHPLRAFERCVRRMRAFPPPRRNLGATPRRKGEAVIAKGRFVLAPRRLVLAQRFPDGYAAALSFTDHADQSSAEKLEAFAFGSSGALARGEVGAGRPGFVNRGLSYTKTIFLAKARAYDRQFDDPRYRKILDELQKRGVEIGVHSPTGGRDTPARSRELLGAFAAAYRGRSWIDHQPYTNCEALSMKGLSRRSPWYILGELARVGFRHVWLVPDVPLRRGSLNMLEGRSGRAHRPVVYRHGRLTHGAASLVGFRSAMLFEPRRRLLARFSPKALARMVAQRGLLVGHVYLDSHRPRGSFANKSLLSQRSDGRYVLRPEIDALFARFARLQAAKKLWVTGIEALAQHLLAIKELEVEHLKTGALRVRRSKGAVQGLTLRVFSLEGAKAPAQSAFSRAGGALELKRQGAALQLLVAGALPASLELSPTSVTEAVAGPVQVEVRRR